MVDGVMLGMMDTVVDEDGVFIVPSKMTTAELEVSEWLYSVLPPVRCVDNDGIGVRLLQHLRGQCSPVLCRLRARPMGFPLMALHGHNSSARWVARAHDVY